MFEFALPVDFQHEWIFSKGSCYLESPGAKSKIVIDGLNDFIHTEEKRAQRKTVFLSG